MPGVKANVCEIEGGVVIVDEYTDVDGHDHPQSQKSLVPTDLFLKQEQQRSDGCEKEQREIQEMFELVLNLIGVGHHARVEFSVQKDCQRCDCREKQKNRETVRQERIFARDLS